MVEKISVGKIYSAFFRQAFSADLALVMVWLSAGIIASYLPVLNQTPLPLIFALPVVIFIPGYCVFAAFFPKNNDAGLSERIVISSGLSLVITLLAVLLLFFVSGEILMDQFLLLVSLCTWTVILIAHYRRAILPPEERFIPPGSEIRSTLREGLFPARVSMVDCLLSIILVLVVFIAITATIYVIASPKENERFTEFFILGENRMAADYPYRVIVGQNYPMYIGVGNHEYQNVTYTIESWVMLTGFDNLTNSTTITVMEPHDNRSVSLIHNQTREIPYYLSLDKTGYNRIEFLLFNGSVPGPDVTGSDRINASYRDLYLRINITDV
jgi:uncharacterized membrane protein